MPQHPAESPIESQRIFDCSQVHMDTSLETLDNGGNASLQLKTKEHFSQSSSYLDTGNHDLSPKATSYKRWPPALYYNAELLPAPPRGESARNSVEKEDERARSSVSTLTAKEKGKKTPAVKRLAPQSDDSEEKYPTDQPRKKKRPRGRNNNQELNKCPPPKKPFACPNYRNDPAKGAKCVRWRDVKLELVKKHVIEEHVKPLRCGRCRTFKAGTPEEITEHLKETDCEKLFTPDPFEKDDIAKVKEIERAKTWERIYEVLYPPVIPDPFYVEKGQNNVTDQHIADSYPDFNAAEYLDTISSQGFDLLALEEPYPFHTHF